MAKTIYMAGGGTGGHLFPGLAVAAALAARVPGLSVEFIGTREGMDEEIIAPSGHRLHMLAAGRGSPLNLKRPLNAPRFAWSLGQCWSLFRRTRPLAVLGLGGFAAGAPGLVARWTGTPLYLLEPNAIPGRVNRCLAAWARGIFLQYDAARPYFDGSRAWRETSGSPLRPAFNELCREAPAAGGAIVVLGGSQGARRLNELFVAGARALSGLGARIVHVAGRAHADAVRRGYQDLGLRAEVMEFCDDMPGLLRRAGLAVSRSGAGSLSELAAAGVPALLVPLPSAKDDHQRANARVAAAAGAAELIDETSVRGDGLGVAAAALWRDGDARRRMGEAMRRLARPEAAAVVAERILAEVSPADL